MRIVYFPQCPVDVRGHGAYTGPVALRSATIGSGSNGGTRRAAWSCQARSGALKGEESDLAPSRPPDGGEWRGTCRDRGR